MQQYLILPWMLFVFSNTVHDTFCWIPLEPVSRVGLITHQGGGLLCEVILLLLCSLLLTPLMLSYITGISPCSGECVDI
ncbi:hypothetical protein BDV32DRAFT_82521 [Aspergillus pseudonomiae]|uniref:Uncharacterized protein n=1 Tax=Aspergillus pseudonomiae TaxID=1506151 RepID=A0A5N6HSL1_9EURO|nr:uncharacterized protein BDV37DRAFT_195180 [Aspergillus pseudonomiae]KAB8257491.1 hypothetical protein BDV32DRAFT_82521 [Aspergillus pseudonomiae]KAE8400822.1 hypothetical protein BDV37DRAFT_195180 [Aspergillus pseudonomiae]